ncbi:MAG TPA: multidrug ABC transporter ATP-binding protein, partial [Bacillota bacterium]|nr:multidrug ABC transporter ATP-binding protein [Bacillota bacterium]
MLKDLKKPFQYKKIPLEGIRKRKYDKAQNTWGTTKRIWSYLAREKVKLSLVILMVIISSAMALAGPYLVGVAIDKFIVTKEVSGLGLLLIGLIIVYLFHSTAIFMQNFWMIGIA